MIFKLTNFSVILFITTLINFFTTTIAWQRRKTKGGAYFAFGMLGVTIWTLAASLDYAAIPLQLKIFFAKLETIGYSSALSFLLLAALSYASYDGLLKKRPLKAIFFLIPTTIILLAWTNELHGLFWSGFKRSETGDNIVIFEHGPAFFGISLIGYLMITVIVVSLWLASRRGSELSRRQMRLLLFASIIPVISNVIYLLDLPGYSGIDWTSITFSISGLFFLVALYGTRFLDIIPVARHTVFEKMADPVLVLDIDNQIVDFNLAAQKLLELDGKILGNSITSLLTGWPEIVELALSDNQKESQVTIIHTNPSAVFDTRLTHLEDERGQGYGKLLVFRDITEQHRAEHALGERVKELKSIYDLAKLVETPDISLNEILQGSVKLIVVAMQYPELAWARLLLGERVYVTENYQETASKLSQDIVIAGGKVGLLEVGYQDDSEDERPLPFLKEERKLLHIMAERLEDVIQNVQAEQQLQQVQEQLIEQQRELAINEERQRMARDLHDSLSQSIHSMVLFSETLGATLEKKNFERAAQIMERLRESARQSHKETRLLLYQLQAEAPESSVDLVRDLEERLAKVERHTGVKAQLVQDGSLECVPLEWHKNLFWIAIEALNNALKHAQARNVQVLLHCSPEYFEMEIKDDGIGFETTKVGAGGLGLGNMRARADTIDGKLTIQSEPGGGTIVRFVGDLNELDPKGLKDL